MELLVQVAAITAAAKAISIATAVKRKPLTPPGGPAVPAQAEATLALKTASATIVLAAALTAADPLTSENPSTAAAATAAAEALP